MRDVAGYMYDRGNYPLRQTGQGRVEDELQRSV